MATARSAGLVLSPARAVRRRVERARAASPAVATRRWERETRLVERRELALEDAQTKEVRQVVGPQGPRLGAPLRAVPWAVPERRVALELRAASAADRPRVVRISIVVRAAAERPAAIQDPTPADRCQQLATELRLAAASAGKDRAYSARTAASFNADAVDPESSCPFRTLDIAIVSG